MRPRSSFLIVLLIVFLSSPLALGAPEFQTYLPNSLNLNPLDEGVLVHEIRVEEVLNPLRIKELTVRNEGTVSATELSEINLRFRKEGGEWSSVKLEDLSGINSGITFSLPGDGMTLEPGDEAEFRLLVSVASPERVPLSKYGEDVSLELSGMFHYVYLDERGEAMESVSSNWVTDPGVDTILRGGFEEIEARSLESDILQPGTNPQIGSFVFRDDDSNDRGVETDLIKVENKSRGEDPLVFGKDITELTLNLKIREGDGVTEKTIRREINSPTTEVTIPTEPDGWWDGGCEDGCEVELEVKGKIAESEPVQGMELKTGVTLETREDDGISGYPFQQRSVVPDESAQSIVVQGLESIEESTDWRSGVINLGEVYTQRLILYDDDRDDDDFFVNNVSFRNEGTLENSGVEEVSVYRVEPDGSMTELASDLKLSSDWQELREENNRIPDDGRAEFEIRYEISEEATEGTTFQPVVQFRGAEGAVDGVPGPVHRSSESLTVYHYGAEILEASRGSLARSPITGREGVIAQRIDLMDKDENRFDLLINPIVIKNTGTATGSDFRKLELYDSDGELLVTKTDLRGLSTAGVTLDNLDGKTRVKDSQAGNWRTFYIYLVPKERIGEETLDLHTTLYMTEGGRDVVKTLQGPERKVPAGVAPTRRDTQEESRETDQFLDSEQPFGFGFAAGTSYPNFPSLSAKLFLEAPLGELELNGPSAGKETVFSRFGFEVDSVTASAYYYPNLSLGYKWPYDRGVSQFVGAGGGAVLPGDTGLGNTIGIHGVYGITTTELFEEDVPVLLQAQVKYLGDPMAETVFGINLGVLFD
ncbi:MAG: hypothetical protein ACLFO4_03690 [Candidatus Acetothermia bacterium]